MRGLRRIPAVRCLGFLLASATLGGFACAQESDLTTNEIRRQLIQWEQSMPQFWIVWESEWDPHSKLASEAEMAGVKSISREEWGRTVTGAEYWHVIVVNDGVLDSRRLWTRDGRGKSFSAAYEAGESAIDRPSRLTIMPDLGGWSQAARVPFFGLWDTRNDSWLGAALEKYTARIDGTERWNGRELPLLVVDDAEHSEVRLALDPLVGYLPRSARRVAADGLRVGHNFETLEIREILPGYHFLSAAWTVPTMPARGGCLKSSSTSRSIILTSRSNGGRTFVEDLVTGRHGYHGTPPPPPSRRSPIPRRLQRMGHPPSLPSPAVPGRSSWPSRESDSLSAPGYCSGAAVPRESAIRPDAETERRWMRNPRRNAGR